MDKQNQLLELLASQDKQEGLDGFTAAEVAVIMECALDKARAAIKRLIAEGKMAPAKVKRVNMVGISTTVYGYKLVED